MRDFSKYSTMFTTGELMKRGEKFTYQNPDQPLGDGELFYVNNTNGIFYRVTVLNNVGYKPSEDPFSMYIEDRKSVV